MPKTPRPLSIDYSSRAEKKLPLKDDTTRRRAIRTMIATAALPGLALPGRPAEAKITRTKQNREQNIVSVKDFGAVGNSIADDTQALNAAIASRRCLYFPEGTYSYSVLKGLDVEGTTWVGAGSSKVTLRCIGTGTALTIGTKNGFRDGINISGLTIEGNDRIRTILRTIALSRSCLTDINLREASSDSGIAWQIDGCSLNQFSLIMCSINRQEMLHPPHEGLRINALKPLGNSSNNTFTNCYFEGNGRSHSTIEIGVRLTGADQNLFLGGSPEACGTYGLLISSKCRYNSFIGVGFENLHARSADISDAGVSTHYLNCYSSHKMIIQGRAISVRGGYFERVQVDRIASKTRLEDITVNAWDTGKGGFIDNGESTQWSNIYDHDKGRSIYPHRERSRIDARASPFRWLNNTGSYASIVIQSGKLVEVRHVRKEDSWLVSNSVPNSHIVAPNDSIEISYNGRAPDITYLEMRGFTG